MNKIRFFIALFVCVLSFTCFAFLGCDEPSDNGNGSTETGDGTKQEVVYINPAWQLSGETKDFYLVNEDGTITSDLAVEDISVEFGTNLFLTLPVVIDGAANVLTVEYEVKDKAGIKVDLVGGSFYAMSGTGYVITYTVTGVDLNTKTFKNTVTVTGADKMYVGEDYIISLDELTFVKDVKLITVESASYDLKQLLTDKQKADVETAENQAGVEVKWNVSSKSTGTKTLDSSVLSFEEMPKANYVVYAQALTDESSQILFAESVDFYDKADGFEYSEWNNIVHDTIDVSTLITSAQDTTVEVVLPNAEEYNDGGILNGKQATYYKVTSTNGSKPYTFAFNALHSMAYYDMYKNAGVSVLFDVYITASYDDDESKPILGVFGTCLGELNGVYKESRLQYTANKWNTVKLSLEKALNGSTCGIESLFYVSGGTTSANESKIYFGNLRIEQDLSNVVKSDKVNLIDVQESTTYDIKNLLPEDEYEGLVNAGATWELVPFNTANKIVLTGSTVNFTEVPYGAYTATATSGGLALYGIYVDFFNSNKAPEFNDIISLDYIFGYRATSGTSQDFNNRERMKGIVEVVTLTEENHSGKYYHLGVNDNTPQATITGGGTWGTPLAFNVMATHSKEYYELYKDYNLTYEYYLSKRLPVGEAFASGVGEKLEGWHTVSVSVQTLLDKWDNVHDNEVTSGYGYAMFTVNIAWPKAEYYVYLGNFNVVK